MRRRSLSMEVVEHGVYDVYSLQGFVRIGIQDFG